LSVGVKDHSADACGNKILIGDLDYDLAASNGDEIRLNSDCYSLLMNEFAALAQRRRGAAG
jgi:hypothetical protein